MLVVHHHYLQHFDQMSREYQVIGREFERSEYVGSDNSGHVVQIHCVVLRLVDYFAKEANYIHEYFPVEFRHMRTYLPDLLQSLLFILDIRQVPEP